MSSRTSLVLVGLVAGAGASGCRSTWDLTPRGITQLHNFASYESIQLETTENETVTFNEKSGLTFRGFDNSVATVRLSRIIIQDNVLIGHESTLNKPLYVDLTRMKTVQVDNFSAGYTALAGVGVGVPLVLSGLLLIAAGSVAGGRPLRVSGQSDPVRAPVVLGRRAKRELQTRGIDERTRQALRNHWAQEASAECASIPAFWALARDLKKIGAPEGLVNAALRAAREEATHTNLCLALANAQSEHFLETFIPDAPTSTDADREAMLQRLTLDAFWDGCVAEGAAAIIAEKSLMRTQDAETRLALQTIAADETRHAALARDIVRYGLEAGIDVLRQTLYESLEDRREAFEAELNGPTREPTTSAMNDEMCELGVPGEKLKHQGRIEAWERSVSFLRAIA